MCFLDMIRTYIFFGSGCTERLNPFLLSYSLDLICFLNVIEILNYFFHQSHEKKKKKTFSSVADLVLGSYRLKKKYSFRSAFLGGYNRKNQLLPALCLDVMGFINLIQFIIFYSSYLPWKNHSLLPTLGLFSMCFLDLIDVYNFFLTVFTVENIFFSCQPYVWVSCAEK